MDLHLNIHIKIPDNDKWVIKEYSKTDRVYYSSGACSSEGWSYDLDFRSSITNVYIDTGKYDYHDNSGDFVLGISKKLINNHVKDYIKGYMREQEIGKLLKIK